MTLLTMTRTIMNFLTVPMPPFSSWTLAVIAL
jgi:hypothetical protein